MPTARGIRNNNPGNIRSGVPWKGVVGSDEAGFDRFIDAAHGIRAAAKQLQTYQTRDKLQTIRGVVSKWAPKSENDTEAYIASVSLLTDWDADAALDFYDFDTVKLMLRAMFRVENGKPTDGSQDWYDAETYERGLRMAGVAPSKPLTQSRTTTGVVVGGASGAALAVMMLAHIWPEHKDGIAAISEVLTEQWPTISAILVGALAQARALWARIDDKTKGRL